VRGDDEEVAEGGREQRGELLLGEEFYGRARESGDGGHEGKARRLDVPKSEGLRSSRPSCKLDMYSMVITRTHGDAAPLCRRSWPIAGSSVETL